jgi:AraC-like DNA-binding protein
MGTAALLPTDPIGTAATRPATTGPTTDPVGPTTVPGGPTPVPAAAPPTAAPGGTATAPADNPRFADPLSDTLALSNARCAISRGFTATGTWGLHFPAPGRLKLTAVVTGGFWLVIDAIGQRVRLDAGDVVIFDGRHPYALVSDLAVEPVDGTDLVDACPDAIVRIGEPGPGPAGGPAGKQGGQPAGAAVAAPPDTISVGGHIDLNPAGKELLLQALPPLIHVRAADNEAPALGWLLDQLLHEVTADRPGAGFAVDQLAQLLFVQVLRAHLGRAGSCEAGWLRAFADERLAPALRLMHSDPARPWHLEELARAAAMSRTTFAERFKSAAGVPPLTYLLIWRMRLAERALREDDIPLADLGRTLGYTSESAFSNAFKRTLGVAPKRYRDASRAR